MVDIGLLTQISQLNLNDNIMNILDIRQGLNIFNIFGSYFPFNNIRISIYIKYRLH